MNLREHWKDGGGPMRHRDLIAEVIDGIREHYKTGHFDRETAIARIKAAGNFTDLGAADMLDHELSAAERYSRAMS